MQRRRVAPTQQNERLIKEEFIQGANLDTKALVAKDLLSLLLPKFVLDRMQNFFEIRDDKQVFEVEDPVTILFCDIADFDDVVRKNENNVVFLLDKIFRKFDDMCMMHGVQKIETVGKTYMAAAGLKYAETSDMKLKPTLRVLNMAKDMMNAIRDYEGLKLKIGIHVGKPVMGVIGYHKPQFSLIGDVVNTTSRHCTTGKKGRIMLSQEAQTALEGYNLLSKGYKMEVVRTEMKGKGMVNVYHLYPTYKRFKDRLVNILQRAHKYADIEERHREIQVLEKLARKLNRKNNSSDKFYKLVIENLLNAETIKKVFKFVRKEVESQKVGTDLFPLQLIDELSMINPPEGGNGRSDRRHKSTGTQIGFEAPNQMLHDDSIVGVEEEKLEDEVVCNHPVREADSDSHPGLQRLAVRLEAQVQAQSPAKQPPESQSLLPHPLL
jgi:class 3 adenylate cyclase